MTELKFKYGNAGKSENKTEEKKETGSENVILYGEQENARNVCFVMLDGKQIFLSYAYLISGEFDPEQNVITLTFSTQKVTLTGNKLEGLFEQLMLQMPRKISCVDKRYKEVKEESQSIVTEITLKAAGT